MKSPIEDKDLRIDVYNNWVDNSAVRITHIPTGCVVTNDHSKSQMKNRLAAMAQLELRLQLLEARGVTWGTKEELLIP